MTLQLRIFSQCVTIAAVTTGLFAGTPIAKRQPSGIARIGPKAGTNNVDRYRLTQIQVPFSSLAQAVDIDDRKTFGGVYSDPSDLDGSGNPRQKTFVFQKGKFVSIVHDNDLYTLLGPTANGDVTIGNWGSDDVQHAGFYDLSNGVWTQLPDVPGRPINFGWRFTTSGLVLGSACAAPISSPTDCVGWTWNGRAYSFFTALYAEGGPGRLGTMASSINNRGDIAGYYSDAGGALHPFLYARGAFKTIDPPNQTAVSWIAYDMNNSGQVVLIPTPTFPFPDSAGVLYDGGTFTELPQFPNSAVTAYLGLNDAGELVGVFVDDTGFHPFLAVRK